MIRENYLAINCEPLPWQQEEQIQMTSLPQQQEQKEDPTKWAMTGISYPGKHDVMLGRGGESNYHTGNLTFRSFIQEHKIRYQKARKQDKPVIALEVVLAWRDLNPPGRFLTRIDPSRADSLWEDVGDDLACKRAGRTLGEKCSGKAAAKHQQQQMAAQKAQAQASREEEDNDDEKQRKSRAAEVISADNKTSLDSIIGLTPTTTDDKSLLSPKLKRRAKCPPQTSMDFISSFKRRQFASTSSSSDALPPTKKRRPSIRTSPSEMIANTMVSAMKPPVGLRSPSAAAAGAELTKEGNNNKDCERRKSSVGGELYKLTDQLVSSSRISSAATVYPNKDNDDPIVNKVLAYKRMMVSSPLPPAPAALADIEYILSDRQREKAFAMRKSIPTAEFLTRAVTWD